MDLADSRPCQRPIQHHLLAFFDRLEDDHLGERTPGAAMHDLSGDPSVIAVMLDAAVERRLKVAYFDLVGSELGAALRIVSHLSGVPLARLRSADLAAQDWHDIARAIGCMGDVEIVIDQRHRTRTAAAECAATSPFGASVVLIDD